ncbi:MAG: TolC family protein [Syntrophomonadaceae bacterium]
MRYIKIRGLLAVFIAITLVMANPLVAKAAVEELSIADAVAIATSKNPEVTSLKLQVDRANILRDDAADLVTFFSPDQLLVNPEGQMIVNSYEQLTIQLKTLKKQLESEQGRVEKDVVNAYTAALMAANDMEATKLTLAEMDQQKKLFDLAQGLGMVSTFDHNTLLRKVEQLEDGLKIQEKQYAASIATLRALLNQSSDWDPVLTSQPVISEYPRQSLATEFTRAADQSVLRLGAQTARDLEQIKVYWPSFDGQDAYMDQIQRNVKDLEYEKTKRDTYATVEQLYHGMDALEMQIGLFQKQLEEKQRDLGLQQLRYDLGMIPLRSMQPGVETLESAQNAVTKAQLELKSLQAGLAANKANYAYLTGQTVYSKTDWQ